MTQKSTNQGSKTPISFIMNDKVDNSIGETSIDEYENNYYQKANDLRIALINKLSLQGQLFSEKEKKYQTSFLNKLQYLTGMILYFQPLFFPIE